MKHATYNTKLIRFAAISFFVSCFMFYVSSTLAQFAFDWQSSGAGITFLKPFTDSMRGYFSIRDRAWFIHPIMCWAYLYSYGVATIK